MNKQQSNAWKFLVGWSVIGFLISCFIVFLMFNTSTSNKLNQDYSFTNTKTMVDRDKVADFVLKCVQVANPHSDEEGKDLVSECHRVSSFIYTEKITETIYVKYINNERKCFLNEKEINCL